MSSTDKKQIISFDNIISSIPKQVYNFEWLFCIKTNLHEQRTIKLKSKGENLTHAKNIMFRQIMDISKYGTPILYIYENGNNIIILPDIPEYTYLNYNDCEYAEITYDILNEFSKTIDQNTIDKIKREQKHNLQDTIIDVLECTNEFNVNAIPFIPQNNGSILKFNSS